MKFHSTRLLLLALSVALFAPFPVSAGPDDEKKPAKKDSSKKTTDKKRKKAATPKGFKSAPRQKAKFVVDEASERNQISFKSNIPGHVITGKGTQAVGELEFNPRVIREISGQISVPWNSLDTNNPMRNDHMRSPPWIDAAAHPDIVFTFSDIESLKAGNKDGTVLKARLIGTMAMNGAEKKMKIPVTLAYVGGKKSKKAAEDEEDVTEGIGIQAKFNVKLADFNIEGRQVGTKVAATQNIKVSLFLKRVIEDPPAEPTSPPPPTPRRPRARQH